MKYTKAPWAIISEAPKQASGGADCYMVGNAEWNIKDMSGPSQATNDENVVCIVPHHKLKTCDGNLRLIVAAPLLYEALRALVAVIEDKSWHPHTVAEAKEALKKAEAA